ncbi:hypothetical protein [Rathayibacter tanaceti]|uniref:DNA polymerase III subunit gamma/tau n=1 Tax=Rathayibacter tanaceti TaxID=1671680 RepID=A0A162G079_9MICO|nr:hypothetical protein [Rathayibacter tanaceti]KZX22190.1 hypothetical protein ACH61_00676 [Rathayibacter tanaceti]
MIEDRRGRSPEGEDEDGIDADALEWAGEDADPTLSPGEARVRRVPRVAAEDVEDESVADAASSSALLIGAGIAAGLYLLYTIAWLITATRQGPVADSSFAGDPLGGGLYSLGLWLAVAAPATWFAVVLLASGGSRVRTRVLWLVAGLVLLARCRS